MTSVADLDRFPAWEAQLAVQRGPFNAILATARAAGAPVEALRTAMRELGPPAESLLAVLPPGETADAACRALTELVCDLVVRKLWHERSAERWAVRSVLAHLPRAMARSTNVTIQVVVHGAGRIARGTDLAAWGARLAAADAHLSDDDALRSGAAVAAWRSGLVRVRSSALTAAGMLASAAPTRASTATEVEPDAETSVDAALRALLGLAGPEHLDVSPGVVLAANAADPFSWPGAPQRGTAATYGGYRAFGGPWAGVPVVLGAVVAATPTWRVLADGIPWLVVADVHGHVVLREPPGGAPSADVPSTDTARQVQELVTWEDEITGAAAARSGQQPVAHAVLVSRATSCRLDLVRVPTGMRVMGPAPSEAW